MPTKNLRIISRLDIKGGNVIKGIQFECLRVMGLPLELANNYYLGGADEIIYIDTVANLYGRSKLVEIVKQTSAKIHIPLIVAGGVRNLKDIEDILKAGADKVAINTAATKNPNLLREASQVFGSQCIVSSIETKKINTKKWEAYVDNGREKTNLDVIDWTKKVQDLGVGEILLTSVDRDGTESGLDEELIEEVSKKTRVSLIVSGGIGKPEDYLNCIKKYKVDGVAAGTIFHYNKFTINHIKEFLLQNNEKINMRITKTKLKVNTDAKKKYDIDDYNKYSFNQMRNEKLKVKNVRIPKALDKNEKDFEIGVINYGINNLQSVKKAFERISVRSKWIDTPEEVIKSKALVLPGIGTFEYGMKGLKKGKLIDAIKYKVSEGTPLLGICLGMQLLFTESEEYGLFKGLNLIPGRVVKFKDSDTNIKIPHMGWNQINPKNKSWKDTIIKNTNVKKNHVYFVHSFFSKPDNEEHILATSTYGENEFCSVVQYKNILGCQFHPEKSGETGLDMLKEFSINLTKK